ncbi:hypothetical protein IAU59_000942 [Kwoniella sp. CBS 9459]
MSSPPSTTAAAAAVTATHTSPQPRTATTSCQTSSPMPEVEKAYSVSTSIKGEPLSTSSTEHCVNDKLEPLPNENGAPDTRTHVLVDQRKRSPRPQRGPITEAWWAFNFLLEVSRLEGKNKEQEKGGDGDHRVRHFVPGVQLRRKDEA